MEEKPKVAICWFGACGGCDETIVDMNEDILKLAKRLDIILWPIALDFKYRHIENLEDREIFLGIINGAVRNSEHEEIAHLMRRKCQHILAFGACACFGGTPSLANLRTKDDILEWVYQNAPTVTNPSANKPQNITKRNGHELFLPEFYDGVFPLNRVIDVDYYLPGCPPSPDLVRDAFNHFLSGYLPQKGITFAPPVALCALCERNETKPERFEISEFKRIHEIDADPQKCFLAQGILCLGPATRGGCGCVCMHVNIPCRGCMGPVEGIRDMGSKYLSAVASLITGDTEEKRRKIIDGLPDLVGYFYRFSVGSSLLGKKKTKK